MQSIFVIFFDEKDSFFGLNVRGNGVYMNIHINFRGIFFEKSSKTL